MKEYTVFYKNKIQYDGVHKMLVSCDGDIKEFFNSNYEPLIYLRAERLNYGLNKEPVSKSFF